MNIFIRKILLFILFLGSVIILLYNGFNIFLNPNLEKDGVYVWGDSQTYFGIDLKVLRSSEKIILSSAQTGSGVYDFLVFSKKIPNTSTAIVGISKPFFLRAKDRDRNDSGFSFSSIRTMKESGYSMKELFSIVKKNLIPKKQFNTNTKLYDISDSIDISSKELNNFKVIFYQNIDFVDTKEDLFFNGITNLINKNCKVILVEFPLNEKLYNFEIKSNFKISYDNYKNKLIRDLNIKKIDTVKWDSSLRLMHDLTHLNKVGAKLILKELLNSLSSSEKVQLLIINDSYAK